MSRQVYTREADKDRDRGKRNVMPCGRHSDLSESRSVSDGKLDVDAEVREKVFPFLRMCPCKVPNVLNNNEAVELPQTPICHFIPRLLENWHKLVYVRWSTMYVHSKWTGSASSDTR